MPDTLNIKTGLTHTEIKNEDGEVIGSFAFLPSDPDILGRAEQTIEFFNELEFPDLSETDQRVLFCAEIKKRLDFLLGCNTEKAFQSISPVALMENGDFYFEAIVEYVCSVVEKEHKARINKKLQKVRKAVTDFKNA